MELLPRSEQSAQTGQRITPDRYASPSESGLEADVVPGENRFNFDLSSVEEEEPPATDPTEPSNNAGGSQPMPNETEVKQG